MRLPPPFLHRQLKSLPLTAVSLVLTLSLLVHSISARAQTLAPSPFLLKDINPSQDVPSHPNTFCVSGSFTFFVATTSTTGGELWKTDGTAAGTILVKDINPGVDSSDPTGLTVMNGVLYFAARNAESGIELWKSDGTSAGTVLVKDIYPASSSYPTNLTAVGSTLFFSASNSADNYELWKSDGTTAGTVLVKDINPGGPRSAPSEMLAMGGVLYFQANDGTNGAELWRSDGTLNGTTMVKNVDPSIGSSSSPRKLTVMNGVLYFHAMTSSGFQLWRSDGSTNGTVLVANSTAATLVPTDLVVMNNILYFQAWGGATSGTELWKSNGNPGNATLVKDIIPGLGSSSPSSLTVIGSTLYFRATDTAASTELWKSDGTSGGTQLVEDINPGVGITSNPGEFTSMGGILYFRATSPSASGQELWRSDGSADGTFMVKEINTNTFPNHAANPSNLTVMAGNTLLFSATDTSGDTELWKSDGTEAGTVMVKNLNAATKNSVPSHFTTLGGKLYFQADDGLNGPELWMTDGTPAGTTMVMDINAGAEGSAPQFLTTMGNALYFRVYRSTGDQLWKSDGTQAGTSAVSSGFTHPTSLTVWGGFLYFIANNGSGTTELWRTNDTGLGTTKVKVLPAGVAYPSASALTVVGNTLFFRAHNPGNGTELWKSDGTSAGTVLVKDIYPGTPSSTILHMTALNDKLYFSANGGSGHTSGFWTSDGTSAGTVPLNSPPPPPLQLEEFRIEPMTVMNGVLYFHADHSGSTNSNTNGGYELWKSTGAGGTSRVKDINVGGAGSLASPYSAPLVLGSTLYFRASTETQGVELWKTDGTSAGTTMVSDIAPGGHSAQPKHLTAGPDGSTFYFMATNGTRGHELWQSDGTAAGTTYVEGTQGTAPADLQVVGDYLFFTATTEAEGQELWAYYLGDDTTPPTGGTMALSTASPASLDPAAPLGITFANWTDDHPPLSYAVLINDAIISPPGPTASRNLIAPLTPGTYAIKGRIYDAVNLFTEVATTLTINTPLQTWRKTHFGTTSNTGTAADTFDHDHDGIPNLLEWATGLNPATASTLPADAVLNPIISNLDYTYIRSLSAVNSGATYTVEWSDTLVSDGWSTTDVTQQILTTTATTQTVKATLPTGTSGRRFVRLRVIAP